MIHIRCVGEGLQQAWAIHEHRGFNETWFEATTRHTEERLSFALLV